MQYNAVIVNSNLSLELKQNCSRIIYEVRQSCTWLVESISVDFTSQRRACKGIIGEDVLKNCKFSYTSLRTSNRLCLVRKKYSKLQLFKKKCSMCLYQEYVGLWVPTSTLNLCSTLATLFGLCNSVPCL